MTGPEGTTNVNRPRGSTHTGSGNQYVGNWYIVNDRLVRNGVPRLSIVREHRRRLARRFVHPRFYGTAAERLRDSGSIALIDGPPGSGRRAAATMLLDGTSTEASRIEELPSSWEEGASEFSAEHRYLLDLSHVVDSEYPGAQQTLMRYRGKIEECGARMVAVLPAGLEWMLDTGLAPAVVPLERPSGRTVFIRYLRVSGIEFEPEHLDIDPLVRMFATAPMRELARLADFVAQARASGQYGTHFTQWLTAALGAVTNWSKQVSQQLRDHRDVMSRALLLTTAMISGGRAETVLTGAQHLIDLLGYETDETPRLAQDDLGEQLAELEIVRADDGRVGFAQLDYDGAVRSHFWRNYPDLRDKFRDWVGQCVELRQLGREDRRQLAVHFTEQALEAGRPEDLYELVERWTRSGSGLRAEAAAVLELGLSHDQYGAGVRARIYTWATSSGLPPNLVRTLVDVCHQVVAVTHPDQALVRLRHLALRHNGAAGDAARSAAAELARGNRRQLARLINRLLRYEPRPDAVVSLLLNLLEPGITRFPPPWEEFTLAWRAVMITASAAAWTPLVRRWLSYTAEHSGNDRGINALVLAAVYDPALLNRLYVTARDWADRPPADAPYDLLADHAVRLRVAERFCKRIDVLQGVEAPDTDPDTRNSQEGP
ncbi:hypothetical protein AB0G74_03145 [Streptomyces sp. NPDC020875]|uniref:hypothetical protein n=1 Tax=Streptomyces sp. NPDC020875 TaxID=3154898 RepID=UPI0033F5C7BB